MLQVEKMKVKYVWNVELCHVSLNLLLLVLITLLVNWYKMYNDIKQCSNYYGIEVKKKTMCMKHL